MSDDYENLSKTFTGLHPDEHRISRVLMVGAVKEEGLLSNSDYSLLRRFADTLSDWGIPQPDDFSRLRTLGERYEPPSVRTMNIRADQGGEDFLKSSVTCDAIILCNIPRDIPQPEEIDRMIEHGMYSAVSMVLRSFAASADHDKVPLWREQIENSGANMVMVTNSDGFALSELNNGNFINVSVPYAGTYADRNVGMLVRKDYLAGIESYLAVQSYKGTESPLLPVCVEACEGGKGTFSYSTEHKVMRRLSF